MVCRGCLECLLKLLKFLLTLVGLAMVGYGIYLLVEWKRASDFTFSISLVSDNHEFIQLGRPMLLAVSLSTSILDKLPKAWFIYLFIAVGVILLVISCFGCIGAVTRNSSYLTCYSLLVILLILVELGCAAFIFFDHSWEDAIPTDKTGDFEMIYSFLKENWKIAKWVAVGAVILEALVFLLAVILRAANRPADYDSDDEYISPRQGIRQPLINRQGVPLTGVPVVGTLDQRPSRNDGWSSWIKEKVATIRKTVEAGEELNSTVTTSLNGMRQELRRLPNDRPYQAGRSNHYISQKKNDFVSSESDRQLHLLKQQDEELDKLSASVQRMGSVGLIIQEQLVQENIIDELSLEMDSTSNRLDFVQEKVALVMKKVGVKGQIMMILFLVILFVWVFFT